MSLRASCQIFPSYHSARLRKLDAEVVIMSPKELMYIEDALGHEQFLQAQCSQAEQSLTDPRLKELASQLCQQHKQIFGKLFQLI